MVYELQISKAIEVTKEKERKEGRKEGEKGREETKNPLTLQTPLEAQTNTSQLTV